MMGNKEMFLTDEGNGVRRRKALIPDGKVSGGFILYQQEEWA